MHKNIYTQTHRWMLGKRQVEITFQREEILHTHTHTRLHIKGLLSSTLHCENSCQMTEKKRGRKRERDSENECKRQQRGKKKEKTHCTMGFHQHLYKQSVCILEALRRSQFALPSTHVHVYLATWFTLFFSPMYSKVCQ